MLIVASDFFKYSRNTILKNSEYLSSSCEPQNVLLSPYSRSLPIDGSLWKSGMRTKTVVKRIFWLFYQWVKQNPKSPDIASFFKL